MKTLYTSAALALVCAPSLAQTNIDPEHKYAWGENIGWTNWHDANGGSQGVRIESTFLSGFAWGENIGWINFGDGTPANGVNYANVNGTDFGVNIVAPGDELGGFAWAENKGWVNFGPFPSLPEDQHARIDFAAGRLRGWAWGENIGWMNLDDDTHFVGFTLACYADCDADDALNVFDFLCYFNYFNGNDPNADCDANGALDVFDFLCFFNAFNAGC